MPIFFAQVNDATVRLLAANGFEVITPRTQRCCGALHAHAGEREEARRLARQNLEAFAQAARRLDRRQRRRLRRHAERVS